MENKLFELAAARRSVRRYTGEPVPEGYEVLNLVAIGGKAEHKEGYKESDFDHSKVHYERF